ncbi:large ribosomal subunit protein bL34m [Lissotriton helveticus]
MALLGTLRATWSRAAGGRMPLMLRATKPASQERTVVIFSRAQRLPPSSSLVSGYPGASERGIFDQSWFAQLLPWRMQQVRTRARGNEYQPKNIKRIATHGWLKRISTRGGIEVILRRLIKGRKSLSH